MTDRSLTVKFGHGHGQGHGHENEKNMTESAYLNSILSHMSQGLLFIDFEGHVTTCNAAAEALLGINAHTVLHQLFSSHFRDDIFGFSMQEALKSRKAPKKGIAQIESSQGTTRELEIETTFVVSDSKGIIVLMRDVTELHHFQELAQRNDRLQALGEMAAMVAHEIRNPLGSIKGFASLLQRDLKEQQDLQRLAANIVEGADHLNRLVTNVLNYSRPMQARIESKDLITLVHEVCQHVEADAMFVPSIHLEIKSSLATLMAPVDAGMLQSAILNLIVNAIQAMPSGGALTITLSQDSKHALIIIADTGVGIPPENLQKIFSPFFTTKENGNGFGLAEVHRVIQAHGGHVDVRSVLGQGSTFTIKLPLSAYVH